uniref:BBX high mobility group box domain containing n=1 Tax=Pelusios castaneus TaxID=367368 RepID=A0A8C8R5I9_9SAUR
IWKKNLKKNSTASLSTVPLRLTGKVYLFQGKRKRLEAAQQNNQNPTKVSCFPAPYTQKTKTPVSLHGTIKLLYLSQILQSQHCCMNPWLVAKRGRRGKLRSHTLFGQQMAECQEKPKELPQSSLQKPSSAETDCSDECSRNAEAEETRGVAPDMPAVSAFFSLSALAEVAAMENVHRSVLASFPCYLAGLCIRALFHRKALNDGTSESIAFVISFHSCFSLNYLV